MACSCESAAGEEIIDVPNVHRRAGADSMRQHNQKLIFKIEQNPSITINKQLV